MFVYHYDKSGNLLNDTFNTYTWSVYGDLVSANGATITYDAFGRMVENHSGANQFVQAPNGAKQPLAEMQGQSLLSAFLPLPGGAVANYNSSGLNQYMHADWLGSARLSSTPGRAPIPAMAYAPFGEGYAGGQQYEQFTGINAGTVFDTENQSGSLEDFMFRRYSPVQGRWISPDPAGLGAVDPSNPQSWNRYAYVLNNPAVLIDPLGLYWLEACVQVNGGAPECSWTWEDGGDGGGPAQNPGGGPSGGGAGGTGGANNPTPPCRASQSNGTTSIVSGNATTNAPTIPLGAAIGGAIGGPPGAFLGGIIGSFFGVGGTVSYVSSTQSLYTGGTVVFGLGLGGGTGVGVSDVMVPAGQNPNSIANGPSFSLTFQPNPFLGSTVVKSPGSGPPVVGPSGGTRIPVSGGFSYSFCLKNCGC